MSKKSIPVTLIQKSKCNGTSLNQFIWLIESKKQPFLAVSCFSSLTVICSLLSDH